MGYENLMVEYEHEVKIKEKPLLYDLKGLYKNGNIIIDSNIQTNAEKHCILSEEIGHHFTSSGDILDLTDIGNLKQEKRARIWAYNKSAPIRKIIQAYELGLTDTYQVAEYLNVTEEFLKEAIEYYESLYDVYCDIDNRKVYINGTIDVV